MPGLEAVPLGSVTISSRLDNGPVQDPRLKPSLSVIIPLLNEARAARQFGAAWQAMAASGAEVLLVDGGS